MLKERAKWRRLLGLKGNIYYYSSDPEKKVWSSIQWAAIIAAISTISTALFALENLRMTKANYAVAHPPKLGFLFMTGTHWFNEPKLKLSVQNESLGKARNVWAFIEVKSLRVGALLSSRVRTGHIDVEPNSGEYLTATWNGSQPLSPNEPALLEATVHYENLAGDAQPIIQYCENFDGQSSYPVECPEALELKKLDAREKAEDAATQMKSDSTKAK